MNPGEAGKVKDKGKEPEDEEEYDSDGEEYDSDGEEYDSDGEEEEDEGEEGGNWSDDEAEDVELSDDESALEALLRKLHGPCCEYHKRLRHTSFFEMVEKAFWDTYGARSMKARGRKDHTVYWPAVNPGEEATADNSWNSKAGLFKNPFAYRDDFRAILADPKLLAAVKKALKDDNGKHPNPPRSKGATVYRELLEYRVATCKYILGKLKEGGFKGSANADNDYPCLLLVTPGAPVRSDFGTKDQYETNLGIWTRFVMAHFVGIANEIAWTKGIPIETVMRSSLGHFAPSVAECHSALRINVGLIPKEYMDVLVEAIAQTQALFDGPYGAAVKKTPAPNWDKLAKDYLISSIQKKLKANNVDPVPSAQQLEQDLQAAKQDVAKVLGQYLPKSDKKVMPPKRVTTAKNLWAFLWSKGDSSGKTVLTQVCRRQERLEVLADQVYTACHAARTNPQGSLVQALVQVLVNIAGGFKLADNGGMTMTDVPVAAPQDFSAVHAGPQMRIEDKKFWRVFNLMMSALGGSAAKVAKFADSQDHPGTVLGLHAALEKQNLAFIRKMAPRFKLEADDGVGSDSDEEGPLEASGPKVYSKKVITSTGIRAIHLAHFAARLLHGDASKLLVTNVKSTIERMYYETHEAVTKYPAEFAPSDSTKETSVLFFDLNHCNTTGEAQTDLSFEGFDVVILDHTSSTPARINEYMKKAFASSTVKVVFLVASGLKNEQCGVDLNPYGVVRVVTKKQALRNALYTAIVKAEGPYKGPVKIAPKKTAKKKAKGDEEKKKKEKKLHVPADKNYKHPAASHAIRKAYKSIGAVPTTKDMFDPTRGDRPLASADDEEEENDDGRIDEGSSSSSSSSSHDLASSLTPRVETSERTNKRKRASSQSDGEEEPLIISSDSDSEDLHAVHRIRLKKNKSLSGKNQITNRHNHH